MDISNTETLELHYFFNDDSHSIDAIIRHKCETEILEFIKEIADYFEVELSISTEPSGEGGFIDKYRLRWNNLESGTKVSVRMGIITLAATILMNRNPASTITPEMQKINDEIALRTLNKMIRDDSITKMLDNKIEDSIAAINVKKLLNPPNTDDNELIEQQEQSKNLIRRDESLRNNFIDLKNSLQIHEFSKALTDLEINPKINRVRSNFFKSVKKYDKITHVSTTALKDNNEPLDDSVTITRENFSKFIIESDELPNEVDNEAFIEIISPVLINGKYKWKGFYKGQSIEFYMKDTGFKEAVMSKQISFKSGICIDGTLELKKKINELGETQIIGYSVIAVNSFTEGGIRTQIKRKKKNKSSDNISKEASLFDILDDDDY